MMKQEDNETLIEIRNLLNNIILQKTKRSKSISVHTHPYLLTRLKMGKNYKGCIKFTNPKKREFYTNNLLIMDSLLNMKNVHNLDRDDYIRFRLLEFLETSNYKLGESVNLIFLFKSPVNLASQILGIPITPLKWKDLDETCLLRKE